MLCTSPPASHHDDDPVGSIPSTLPPTTPAPPPPALALALLHNHPSSSSSSSSSEDDALADNLQALAIASPSCPSSPPPSSSAASHLLESPPNGTFAGTVKFFNSQKGYGFIIPDDREVEGKQKQPNRAFENTPPVFVHHSAITKPKSGFRSLAEGETVEFQMVQGGKGYQAANVTGPNGTNVQGDPDAHLYMAAMHHHHSAASPASHMHHHHTHSLMANSSPHDHGRPPMAGPRRVAITTIIILSTIITAFRLDSVSMRHPSRPIIMDPILNAGLGAAVVGHPMDMGG
ncbi:hypothetical protein HDU67_009700 [Dinochytrium kinnereticum]|nr:hypothetical protein HDU67_009700 [Dinochytrium kinnereticum]